MFETGEITIAPWQLQAASAEALNTYLHEIAHVICKDGHTIRDRCAPACKSIFIATQARPPSITTLTKPWRLDRQIYAMESSARDAVKPIADPNTYTLIRAVAARQTGSNADFMLNLLALAVSCAALAMLVFWPWIRQFFQNDIATYPPASAWWQRRRLFYAPLVS